MDTIFDMFSFDMTAPDEWLGHERMLTAVDTSGDVKNAVAGLADALFVKKEIPVGTYAWNFFRYSGDFVHLFGVIVFILTVVKNNGVTGFSKKTQIIYFLMYITRYLDLFTRFQHMAAYLIVFKITFIVLSTISVSFFYNPVYKSTYEKVKDTCSLFLIVFCSFFFMFLLTKRNTVLEMMWTFSELLEAVCLVPQYVFRYRDNENTDMGVFLFILCLGGYRVLYMLNWIYRKIENPVYSDVRSWIAGIIEILFFIDFLAYRLKGFSILRTIVLGVDDRIGYVSDAVEFRVLGKKDDDLVRGEDEGQLRQRRKAGGSRVPDELAEFDII